MLFSFNHLRETSNMFKRTTLRTGFVTSLFVLSLGLSACSSDDDGDDGPDQNGPTIDDGAGAGDGTDAGNGTDSEAGTDAGAGDSTDAEAEQAVAVVLDSASTEPAAVGADDAAGTGDFVVDTETGALSGSVEVSGTTGVPTMAHIHQGAPGVAGPVLVALEPNSDSTVWTVSEGAALDAAGIAAFENGELYVNVHTEANPSGELRAQLDADGGEGEGETTEPAEGVETVSVALDTESTEPAAEGADDAAGTGDFTVDTETGAVVGSVEVTGTTGVPTMAHIHQGAPGVAGPVLIALEPNEDSTVWTVPDSAALDAAGIEAFENGELYVNVHTEANPSGELRAQLVGDGEAAVPATGSVTVSFVNLSESQPMTPPVVILHNAPDSENGIRYFAIGDVVGEEVKQIAENGDTAPLLENAQGQIPAGKVSAAEAAFPEAGGPLLPGDSASVTLEQGVPDQVMSIVAMVVCTNDGFTGVDSMEITEGTFTTPVYDAGSETNVETLDYWVPPCGTDTNLTDDENGVISLHPGQANAENPDFNFASGSQLLEVTISVNE